MRWRRWCSRASRWRRPRWCGWMRWICRPMTSCWTSKPPRWDWGWVMSKTNGELTACLKELHLPTARACYQELADSARREELSHEAYLLEVLQRECQGRRQHRTERLLRGSQRERAGVREPRLRQNSPAVRVRPGTGAIGPNRLLPLDQPAGAGTAAGQAGIE